jgi:CRISPR-associated protein Csx17
MKVADEASWTRYTRGWNSAQKASTKSKSGAKLAQWQAEADEGELELFAAHVAPASRVFFNPLLGSGGNAGKRAFADGWKKATDALKSIKSKKKKTYVDERREALGALLDGHAAAWQEKKLNAASWFSDANKLYNSGQNAFSEGVISPWAMALACEGLTFFAGSASRRLGARSRSVGAFPFVVAAAAPETAGEAGRDRGEVWAPLWTRPMTVPEIAAVFARGRAEIDGRGSITPAAFAAAIIRRGVDAGIGEFRRFALGKTTSANTFEPRYAGATPVPADCVGACSEAFECLLGLIQRLPRDRKEGQRWRFVGLRGPVENALIHLAGNPGDPGAITAVLDSAVQALDRVDVNRSFRESGVGWRPLPLEWLPALFAVAAPDLEARLALSFLSAFPVDYPFALYRFGIDWRYKAGDGRRKKHSPYLHPKAAPARWVWRGGLLTRNLCDVVQRRVLDWGNETIPKAAAGPVRAPLAARLSDVESWLDSQVDELLLERWLSRLALFDWTYLPSAVKALAPFESSRTKVGPTLILYGLFHPLFDLRPVTDNRRNNGHDLLPPETKARTPAAARRMASLLRIADVERAVEVARSRYSMTGAPLIRGDTPWALADPGRLLAGLMFHVSTFNRSVLVRRWLRPQRQAPEVIHV